MTTRQTGLTMAVITGLCWALLAIALRQALKYASSGTIVWFRMMVAFVVPLVYFAIARPQALRILRRPPKSALIAGVGLAMNYFGYMKGLELTNASNAQIMIQLGPLTLLLIGVAYFKERPSRAQTLGLVIAVCGLSLFFWDQILLSVSNAGAYIKGDAWLIWAAFSWAVFAGIQKSSLRTWQPQEFNLLIYGLCILLLFPSSHPQEMASWTPGVWILMIGCGLNTLIAYGAFSEALKRIPASHVSVIIGANPLLTIFMVTTLASLEPSLIIPETIHWRGFLGALFVVTGVIFTVWQKTPSTARV